jgi:DNA-binding NtrC family response regulator
MTQIKPLSQVRREHIRTVLGSTGGDQERASQVLGISLEQLRRLLEQYHLAPPEPAPAPAPSPDQAASPVDPPPPSRQKE